MSWVPFFLLGLVLLGVVTIVVYSLGRRTRPPVSLSHGYRLQWLGDEHGQGFTVVRRDGSTVDWDDLPDDEGLCCVTLSGRFVDPEAVQASAFDPGRPVRLRPEPDNLEDPDAIAVWDADGTVKAGYVPTRDEVRVGEALASGEIEKALVVWDSEEEGERVAIRLLLLGRDAVAVSA